MFTFSLQWLQFFFRLSDGFTYVRWVIISCWCGSRWWLNMPWRVNTHCNIHLAPSGPAANVIQLVVTMPAAVCRCTVRGAVRRLYSIISDKWVLTTKQRTNVPILKFSVRVLTTMTSSSSPVPCDEYRWTQPLPDRAVCQCITLCTVLVPWAAWMRDAQRFQLKRGTVFTVSRTHARTHTRAQTSAMLVERCAS